MRKSIVMLGALAALTMPGMAQAQAQKPDPFVIEENSMMGRQPRVAADKLVPADAGGELVSVRGKGWWQVLSWCAGAYRFHHDEVVAGGNAAGAVPFEERGKLFIEFALLRLADDRGISVDDAVEVLVPEVQYARASAADGGETHRPFVLDEKRCGDVERYYRSAGLVPR